ncbi:MAG TPA: hypothetical protein VF992_11025 [Thermoplasmata archaeon]
MFGTMYPMFVRERALSERVRDRGLADYLRWEYRPADRASVVLLERGGGLLLPRRKPRRRGFVQRIRAWTSRRRALATSTREAEIVAAE